MSQPSVQLPLEIEDFVALSLACGARCVQFAFEPDALLGSFTSLDTVHSEWTGKARPSIQAGLLGSVARLEGIAGAGPALIHVDGRLARLHFSAQAGEDGSPVLIRFTAVDGEAALGRRSDFDFVSGWMIALQSPIAPQEPPCPPPHAPRSQGCALGSSPPRSAAPEPPKPSA